MLQIHINEISEDIKTFIEWQVKNNIFDVSFLYDSSFISSKKLRDIIDTICSVIGISSKWKTRFVLIVDELNSNAIEYGSKEWDENELKIYIEKKDNTFDIKISVQDAGTGEKIKTASQMEELRKKSKWDTPANHKSIRWRGLFMIISNLVDKLYFSDGNPKWLIVGVEKKLEDSA